jgi:sulfur carrier protein ThiS
MKIKVDANFLIMNRFNPPITLELNEGSTLKDALARIQSIVFPIKLLDHNKNPGDDLRRIILNGKPLLPAEVEHIPLQDGDEVFVEIFLEPLGGG